MQERALHYVDEVGRVLDINEVSDNTQVPLG